MSFLLQNSFCLHGCGCNTKNTQIKNTQVKITKQPKLPELSQDMANMGFYIIPQGRCKIAHKDWNGVVHLFMREKADVTLIYIYAIKIRNALGLWCDKLDKNRRTLTIQDIMTFCKDCKFEFNLSGSSNHKVPYNEICVKNGRIYTPSPDSFDSGRWDRGITLNGTLDDMFSICDSI